jgi:peptidoglycan/LPS O-acetylase OafA/YrhL
VFGAIPGIGFLGPSGVDLFFVLSGFLISGILFDHRDSPSYFRTFYIRRVCRIFPVYYLIFFSLLLALPLAERIPALNVWLLNNLMPLWSYPTFTQNFFMAFEPSTNAGGRWIGMTWSVAVEEHFYMLFPFVVRFVSRSAVRDLALLSIVGAAVLRVLVEKTGLWYYPLLPCRVDCLAVGVLLSYAVRQPGVWPWLRDNRPKIYAGMAASALGFAFFRDHMLGYTWLALFFGCVLLLVVVHPEAWFARVCRVPTLQKVGLISYGLYMYHQAVNGTLHAIFFQREPIIRNWLTFAVTLVSAMLSFTIATVSYHAVEKHLLRLGHKAAWEPADQPQATPEDKTLTLPALSKAA